MEGGRKEERGKDGVRGEEERKGVGGRKKGRESFEITIFY